MFRRDGTLYRQINQTYRDNYQTLMDSGLYDQLVSEQLLIPHEEVAVEPAEPSNAFKVINRITIRNKVIILVDDVLTTGSTLNACAKELKKAGAARVLALTIAKA